MTPHSISSSRIGQPRNGKPSCRKMLAHILCKWLPLRMGISSTNAITQIWYCCHSLGACTSGLYLIFVHKHWYAATCISLHHRILINLSRGSIVGCRYREKQRIHDDRAQSAEYGEESRVKFSCNFPKCLYDTATSIRSRAR